MFSSPFQFGGLSYYGQGGPILAPPVLSMETTTNTHLSVAEDSQYEVRSFGNYLLR